MEIEVTELLPAPGRPDMFVIRFSDGEELTLDGGAVSEHGITVSRSLSLDEREDLRRDARLYSAKQRALRLLGRRALSRAELFERLRRSGFDEETAVSTAEWAERIGAVDDMQYAETIVEYYSSRGYGEKRILAELRLRGIDREVWEASLRAMPDQDEQAYAALLSRLGGRRPGRAEMRRAEEALARRGFSWDSVRAALRRYLDENGDIFDGEA